MSGLNAGMRLWRMMTISLLNGSKLMEASLFSKPKTKQKVFMSNFLRLCLQRTMASTVWITTLLGISLSINTKRSFQSHCIFEDTYYFPGTTNIWFLGVHNFGTCITCYLLFKYLIIYMIFLASFFFLAIVLSINLGGDISQKEPYSHPTSSFNRQPVRLTFFLANVMSKTVNSWTT